MYSSRSHDPPHPTHIYTYAYVPDPHQDSPDPYTSWSVTRSKQLQSARLHRPASDCACGVVVFLHCRFFSGINLLSQFPCMRVPSRIGV